METTYHDPMDDMNAEATANARQRITSAKPIFPDEDVEFIQEHLPAILRGQLTMGKWVKEMEGLVADLAGTRSSSLDTVQETAASQDSLDCGSMFSSIELFIGGQKNGVTIFLATKSRRSQTVALRRLKLWFGDKHGH